MKDIKFSEIAYLENSDFDNDGNLINPILKDKKMPILIMIQASWCHYCREAKPVFQKYSKNTSRQKVFCATIHCDGVRKSEKMLGRRVSEMIKDADGLPHYCMYLKGKRVLNKSIKGGADLEQLENLTGIKPSN